MVNNGVVYNGLFFCISIPVLNFYAAKFYKLIQTHLVPNINLMNFFIHSAT